MKTSDELIVLIS